MFSRKQPPIQKQWELVATDTTPPLACIQVNNITEPILSFLNLIVSNESNELQWHHLRICPTSYHKSFWFNTNHRTVFWTIKMIGTETIDLSNHIVNPNTED